MNVQHVQKKSVVVSILNNIRYRFFKNVRNLYATALAIEVVCICAAKLGENCSFIPFGYRTAIGITLG
ncbi:MAG: hypothetical protein WA667_04055 [Candidatus Nitrosopolaris sp.]